MIDKERLEQLWEQATGLPDATESPLALAIIAEAEQAKGDAARAVRTVAQDCENFAAAIEEDNNS